MIRSSSQTTVAARSAGAASARTSSSVSVPCLDDLLRARPAKAALRGEITAKPQPQWLTDVVATVVHSQRGQAKAIAATLGTTENRVRDAADINSAAPLKAWWIPAIVAETGSFAILDALEAQVGRCAFVLPTTNHPEHADLIQHTARVVEEFGQALSRVSASLADGTITQAERVDVEREIGDVHRALCSLQALIAKKAVAV